MHDSIRQWGAALMALHVRIGMRFSRADPGGVQRLLNGAERNARHRRITVALRLPPCVPAMEDGR
jgi:hypothetical protein